MSNSQGVYGILTAICSRCKKDTGSPLPDGGMTAGYYHVGAGPSGWSQFANLGEVYICDECMWSDPRYIAVYGNQPK